MKRFFRTDAGPLCTFKQILSLRDPRHLILLIASVLVSCKTSVSGDLKAVDGKGSGAIKGRFVVSGGPAPVLAPIVRKGDPSVTDAAYCAQDDIPDEQFVSDGVGVGNVVMYLYTRYDPSTYTSSEIQVSSPPDQNTVQFKYQNCRLVPHVAAVYVPASNVEFVNEDPVLVNVRYSSFNNQPFNHTISPKDKARPLALVPEGRTLPIVDEIHTWIFGYMMVFAHPYFNVSGPDGRFTIENVPAGIYRIVGWHETRGYVLPGAAGGVVIEVKEGETLDLGDIKVDVNQLRLIPRKGS